LESLEFEGQTYWTIEEEIPQWKMVNDETLPDEMKEFLLPSDSYLRPDHPPMRNKEFDDAEREKQLLENIQRKDKKMR
jgi:hypothetical protein